VRLGHHKQRWTTGAALRRYFGWSTSTMCRMFQTGVIRGVQVPSRHYTDTRARKTSRSYWRVYEADVLALLQRMRSGTKPPDSLWRR
jgi:hypothetical protein